MSETSIVAIGLPGSGKTTFLAALWHVVTARELLTKLSFSHLSKGDNTHLHEIANRWREAYKQDRTLLQGLKTVQLNLRNEANNSVSVTFPDVPGEDYLRMWEEREIDQDVMDTLRAPSVLFFIHADAIKKPNWIVDELKTYAQWGLTPEKNGHLEWHPKAAPTQVQVVDILQMLQSEPINIGPRKVAIILSVWDKAKEEGLNPANYVKTNLPLLHQYLNRNAENWTYRIFGVSAQGGDYDDSDKEDENQPQAEELRLLDKASTRIEVAIGDESCHDLTMPLAWLME